MLIPTKQRTKIYTKLFQDGVMTAKKDLALPKHGELTDIPNLHVLKLLQSLKNRGYVNEKFSWQWYYWSLTDEGIEYLREFLHLPPSIVPNTFKKAVSATRPPAFGGERDRGARGDFGGSRMDRDGYRGPKKGDDAPSNFNPEFDGRRPFGRGGDRGDGGFGMRGGRGGAPFRGGMGRPRDD